MSMAGDRVAAAPTARRADKHLQLSVHDDAYKNLLMLTMLSTLAPHRLMLAVAPLPRGFSADLSTVDYVVGGLFDGSFPRRHTS